MIKHWVKQDSVGCETVKALTALDNIRWPYRQKKKKIQTLAAVAQWLEHGNAGGKGRGQTP